MKRFQTPILLLLVAALVFFSYRTGQEAAAARRQIEAATAALLTHHDTAAIGYLFRQARTAPSPESLAALSAALRERKQKYTALIQLYHPHIAPETWTAFTRQPNEQATVFFLNLAQQATITPDDWDRFDRIAQIWLGHEETLRIDITGHSIRNPTSFTYQYLQLLQDLDQAIPAH